VAWLREGARRVQAARAAADGGALRQALVDKLVRDGHIRSGPVEAAFRAVPRELFVPGVPLEEAYRSSEAIVTKRIDGVGVSSASAPDVVAIMLEQLDLRPGQRVLEIGAGTGYNAALIAAIVGERGHVVTIDIDEDLVAGAREHLAAAGYGWVEVARGDGARGYPQAAPFDRIMLTVAASDIAPSWREQLRPGGRLVLPLSLRGPQRSVAFQAVDGYLESVSVHCCSFIPLRGELAPATARLPVGPEGGIVLGVHDSGWLASWGEPGSLEAAVYEVLSGPSEELPTGVSASGFEVGDGLGLWLALREERVCTVWADTSEQSVRLVPPLLGQPGRWHASIGLVGERGLALLARPAPPEADDEEQPPVREVVVRAYGEGRALAERLRAELVEWDAVGRPNDRGLRVRAYPPSTPPAAGEAAVVIDRPHCRLVVDWVYEF
jgi:protein-L-isoaspartate(D-aspartate) O-methyltransferase